MLADRRTGFLTRLMVLGLVLLTASMAVAQEAATDAELDAQLEAVFDTIEGLEPVGAVPAAINAREISAMCTMGRHGVPSLLR